MQRNRKFNHLKTNKKFENKIGATISMVKQTLIYLSQNNRDQVVRHGYLSVIFEDRHSNSSSGSLG